MRISILTMSPEQFPGLYQDHVIDRAIRSGVLRLDIVDIRSFADGSFRKVDDSPYGGGAGMILRIEPVMKAVSHARTLSASSHVAVLSPVGERYDQEMARQLSDFTRRSIDERSVSVRSRVKLLLRTKPKGWTPNASNT